MDTLIPSSQLLSRDSFAEVRAIDGLSRVLDAAHNVVVWRRPPLDPKVAQGLARHADTRPAPAVFEGPPARLDAAQLTSGIADAEAARWVAKDARALVAAFAALSGRDHVHVQLVSVADGACRKLHVDYIGLRLLVTYVGPGTQWAANGDVERSQLARADLDADTNNASILRPGAKLRQLETNDVAVLKGEFFRGNTGRGAVHRSPPVSAGAAPRLLLKVDVAQCGC